MWTEEDRTARSSTEMDGVPQTPPPVPVHRTGNSHAATAGKKASSLPSILDIMDEDGNNTENTINIPGEGAPLRSTRSVSQDRKKKNIHYHAQRSQQDELSPLSSGRHLNPNLIHSYYKVILLLLAEMTVEMRSSNAIVCPAGQNGRTDELSLFPSVESFMKAQGATSTSSTLQRRNTGSAALHSIGGSRIEMQRSPTNMSLAVYNRNELADIEGMETAAPYTSLSLSRFHQLRKQSDLAMIRCIQEDESHRVYFMRPPLSQWTLFFIDDAMEKVLTLKILNKSTQKMFFKGVSSSCASA